MSSRGYNPEFYDRAQRKRALARMQRAIEEAEERAARLERAAREAAIAILDAALEEAHLIMHRAYEAQEMPRRPVAEIIAEVAEDHGLSPATLRGKDGGEKVREARRVALRRALREREDLTYTEVARIFDTTPGVVRYALKEARHAARRAQR